MGTDGEDPGAASSTAKLLAELKALRARVAELEGAANTRPPSSPPSPQLELPPATFASAAVTRSELETKTQTELIAELALEKNKLESIVSAMPSGLTVQDREFNIVYQNPLLAKVFGRLGEKCYRVYEGRETVCVGCPVALAFADGQQHSSERKITMPSGKLGIWQNTAAPIFDADGTVSACLEVATDITERREIEAALQHAQKMEAVGRLGAGVAHDFNNLLAVMKGFAQMTRRALGTDHAAHGYLAQVQRALDRGASLTQRLLAFSRRQTLQPEVVDLNAVVREAAALLGSLLGAQVQLVTRLAPELGLVRVDPGQLDQVIVNLAINARDAMPGGGVLTIETALFAPDPARPVCLPDLPDSRYAEISLADTGTGMGPEVRARIFEPFFTTKEVGKGTGLGLATAYGIMKQSGGAIAVESELGKGSTFRVILPLLAQAAATPEAPSEPTSLPRGSEVVLVVDDERGVLDVVCEILRELGYVALAASGPTEALELASATVGPIQLLVTDLVMPKASGLQLAAMLRQARPELRVLFMSGYGGETLDRDAVDPRDLVRKPFSLETITERIRDALDRPRSGD